MEPVVTFVIGFIAGVVIVALAVELGMKKTSKTEPSSRSTQHWDIAEISNPKIVAEYMGDVNLPKNAKVVVNQYKNKAIFEGLDAKEYTKLKGNFILGDDRALILAGPIDKQELGIWTVEKDILEQLNSYFDKSWSKATEIKHEEEQ